MRGWKQPSGVQMGEQEGAGAIFCVEMVDPSKEAGWGEGGPIQEKRHVGVVNGSDMRR